MKSLCTLLLLLAFGVTTWAQDTTAQTVVMDSSVFQIDSFQHSIPLADYTQVLLDPNNSYQLEDVRKPEIAQDFYPLTKYPDDRFSDIENPWGRVSVQNKLTDQTRFSFSFYSYADSMLVYVIREDGRVENYKTGIYVAVEETNNGSQILQGVHDTNPAIFLTIKKNERIDIFFKIHPTPYCNCELNPVVRSMEFNYQKQYSLAQQYVKTFFYLGAIWMFCLYNLFVFIFYKEKAYLFLALFTFCFIFPNNFMSLIFLVKSWLPNFMGIIDFKSTILSPLVFVAGVSFTRSYLESKVNYPKTDKYLKIMLTTGFVYLVISILAYCIQLYFVINLVFFRFLLALLSTIIAMVLLIPVTLNLYKRKDSRIQFLLASLIVLILPFFYETLLGVLGWDDLEKKSRALINPLYLGDIGVLAQIAILTLGLGYRSREISQEKDVLKEKDELKSRFFTNISHEFRTPLTLILGSIQQLRERTTDAANKQLLDTAYHNANRQLELINDILDLSKLEANTSTLQASEIDLVPLLKGIVQAYSSLAEQKNIKLEISTPPEPLSLFIDQEKFESICYNLLSNAFKFTPPEGRIAIQLEQDRKSARITITDTGSGISEERLPYIFDRFFYSKSDTLAGQEGSGIGLALVKELVTLHHGTITVESKLGKGTTFYLSFPLGRKHLQAEEIVVNPAEHPTATKKNLSPVLAPATEKDSAAKSVSTNSKKSTILLIEDNADVRFFIRQRLEETYIVLEAVNGEEGIQKAFEEMPDLIISDVMMPKMDGYQVCETLKTDIRTSHIPVILLTAKAAQEEKLEGLETGADAYLTKPFDANELLIRIENLIRLRAELRQRFSDSIFIKPSEIETNSLDKEFLEKAMSVVEANMDNEDFSVQQMAQEMAMGKTTLNNKFRALLNFSTNDFIQSVRLQRATDLLRQQAGTVSEIAFQTGFRSVTYFVKVFRKKFGETPGNFIKNHTKKG